MSYVFSALLAGCILWMATEVPADQGAIIAGFGFAYYLPTFVSTGGRQYWSVMLLNTFLGWTVIGWIFAMIWAVFPHRSPTVVVHNTINNNA